MFKLYIAWYCFLLSPICVISYVIFLIYFIQIVLHLVFYLWVWICVGIKIIEFHSFSFSIFSQIQWNQVILLTPLCCQIQTGYPLSPCLPSVHPLSKLSEGRSNELWWLSLYEHTHFWILTEQRIKYFTFIASDLRATEGRSQIVERWTNKMFWVRQERFKKKNSWLLL